MNSIADRVDALVAAIRRYIQDNAMLVAALAALALAAYGFELFGLNLTIDEEMRAFRPADRESLYLSHGRWGLYLLDRFLLPFPIIAFVPLFIALVCHVSAILLLLHCWGVDAQADRFAAGALGVAFPGMAYFHAFSLSNYAIGIGLLCCALSLFIFTRTNGHARNLAVFPAVFAFSIYQGFTVVLAAVYLVWIIASAIRNGGREPALSKLAGIALVGAAAFAAYFLINALCLDLTGTLATYADRILRFDYLRENASAVIERTLATASDVYLGSGTVYAVEIRALGFLVAVSLCGAAAAVLRSSLQVARRIFVILLLVLLLLLPFVVGLFTGGNIPVRFMVALPVVISGLVAVGMRVRSRSYRLIMGLGAGWCVFQFVVSINYLNSSSHLALQADRLLASHVISRIEEARVAAGLRDLKYLEVVGYRERPASPLMPKADTFGASFFEWDHGHAARIVYFFRALGYYNGAEAMPMERRGRLFEVAGAMPRWPAPGSVRIDHDAAIVKFGDYSDHQKKDICEATRKSEFCGNGSDSTK
jgi:hypothetical protein